MFHSILLLTGKRIFLNLAEETHRYCHKYQLALMDDVQDETRVLQRKEESYCFKGMFSKHTRDFKPDYIINHF